MKAACSLAQIEAGRLARLLALSVSSIENEAGAADDDVRKCCIYGLTLRGGDLRHVLPNIFTKFRLRAMD